MGILSEFDRAALKALREGGVFEDVNGHHLDPKNGTIIVACSDGDQFSDLMDHIWGVHQSCDCPRRTHMFTDHAGAARLAPNSPVNQVAGDLEAQIMLNGIAEASKIKDIHTVALTVHAPCARAKAHSQTVIDLIDLQMGGKQRVRELGLKVACFFQVDHGNGRKRTYFISRVKWEEWCLNKRAAFMESHGVAPIQVSSAVLPSAVPLNESLAQRALTPLAELAPLGPSSTS